LAAAKFKVNGDDAPVTPANGGGDRGLVLVDGKMSSR
jgi:hypothetical protein